MKKSELYICRDKVGKRVWLIRATKQPIADSDGNFDAGDPETVVEAMKICRTRTMWLKDIEAGKCYLVHGMSHSPEL